ncbi:MAG: DNA methyltransferase [Saprospiraceae bacterium]
MSGTIKYFNSEGILPHFIQGDSLNVLSRLPDECIDCCITSPPYWGQRSYDAGGIGQENSPGDFIKNLLEIIAQIRRTLKPTGSFWLNIGDTYRGKSVHSK